MNLILEPQAEQELCDAVDWYEQQQAGLGEEFLTAVGGALEQIRGNPMSGTILETQDDVSIRRVILPRFPYLIVYDCSFLPDAVVAHGRRRRNDWQSC